MSETRTNSEILTEYNLNWNVRKARLSFEDENGVYLPTGEFGLIRSDNNKCLGVAKEGYHPFQNENVLNVLRNFADKYDLPFHKGGTLGGGKRIFFLLNVGISKVGNEGIRDYIFAANSFDKTCQMCFGYTNTVISCQNTFNRVMKYDVSYKFRHTLNGEEKILELPGLFEAHLGFRQQINETYQKMEGIMIPSGLTEELIAYLTNTDVLATNLNTAEFDDLSTRKKNIISQLNNDINGEINAKGNSLWGLFNGITWYANHSRTVKKSNTKDESILVGTGHKLMNDAFDFLEEKVAILS